MTTMKNVHPAGIKDRAIADFNRQQASLNSRGQLVTVTVHGRKVTVDIKSRFGIRNTTLATGEAKCHPDDTFSTEIGTVIAMYRAMKRDVPREYTTLFAPAQPAAPVQSVAAPAVSAFTTVVTGEEIEAVLDGEFGSDEEEVTKALIILRRYIMAHMAKKA